MTAASSLAGFVGVGRMGSAMAARTLACGAQALVFDPAQDRTDELAAAGAQIADSAAAVGGACTVVLVVVNTDAQVRDVMLGPRGILAGAGPGTVVTIHSTIHLATLEEVAAAAALQGVAVLDAGVTGGASAAERGELAVMLGGEEHAADLARPILMRYASLVWHVGGLGAGMAAKIAIQAVQFGKLAATYEGLALADAAGIDAVELARVITHSEKQSGLGAFYLKARATSFTVDLPDDPLSRLGKDESPRARKDLHAALELADRSHVDVPVTQAAYDQMPAVWSQDVPRKSQP